MPLVNDLNVGSHDPIFSSSYSSANNRMCECQFLTIFIHIFYVLDENKKLPIFNFPMLNSAKYFYKMAAPAGPSCSEMGLNSQNKNCRVSLEYITK